jgi:UDP-glucose 4-epimerase
MIYLISGSRGYIGSKLVKAIDDTIFEIDLKIGRDILSYDFKEKPFYLYHLAAQSGVPESVDDPINDARQNILGTLKAIEIANKYNAKLIFTTSGAAIGKANSPYGLSKQACEKYIKMLCNDYVILRLSSIYGDKPKGVVDTFIRNKKCCIFGDGTQKRDFVNIDDIVNCLILAKNWDMGTYECGSGKGISINEIAKATGKKIEYLPKRNGDKGSVILRNTTPKIDKIKHSWYPEIDVISYIKNKCQSQMKK